MADVPRDSSSGWYLAQSATHWTDLLDGLSLSNPSNLWLLQEASGNFSDAIASQTLTATAIAAYQASQSGWSRYFITTTPQGGGRSAALTGGTMPNLSTTSQMALTLFAFTDTVTADRDVVKVGFAAGVSSLLCQITSQHKLKLTAAGTTSITGSYVYSANAPFWIALQHNFTGSVQRVITPYETIALAPFTALSTDRGIAVGSSGSAGQCAPGAWGYLANWQGAAAEMSEAQIRSLLSRMQEGPPTTKAIMSRGSAKVQWVVAIDGYPRLGTNGSTAKALAAWAEKPDWTQCLGGFTVQATLEQSCDPNDPFANKGGTCIVGIQPDEDDTFGIEYNRRFAGAWTTLAAKADRDDTTFTIHTNASFAAGPAEAHIGTECVGYSGTGATSMSITTRGKYTACGTKQGENAGDGGNRFAEHHRVALDSNQIQSNPVVSQQPRRWLGRRVHCYLHAVLDEVGTLNRKSNAELVFSGRLESEAEDSKGIIKLRLKHVLAELGDTVIGANVLGGTVPEGLYIRAGARFKLAESIGTTVVNATDLVCVASGASGTNQFNAGYYSLDGICGLLNSWLGGNRAAATTSGQYTWTSPRSDGQGGWRTECAWNITGATAACNWVLTMPSGVAGFLGLSASIPVVTGGSIAIKDAHPTTNVTNFFHGLLTPYRTVVFSKGGSGGSLPTFKLELENEYGEFVPQTSWLPADVRAGVDQSLGWGLFRVDEKATIVARYASNALHDCFIVPGGQPVGDDNEPFYMLGRRVGDDRGQIRVRQILDFEASFERIMMLLHYNTGIPGYNHLAYDTEAHGVGAGIPGSLLGDAFEASIRNLPSAQTKMHLKIEEPTKLKDLIGGDLLARGAFPVWKNGGIVYQSWYTPTLQKATFQLDEENKARPAGTTDDLKTPTLETAQFAAPTTKIDFDPDFQFGQDVRFRASFRIVDGVAIDDGGNDAKVRTIKLRNTPGWDDAIELIKGIHARSPLTSRPSKILQRSIGSKQFLGIAPGDCCLIVDRFARDPLTGLRHNPSTDIGGLDGRPAVLMRHTFDIGGGIPGNGTRKPRDMAGEVDANFFDVNRGSQYVPSADIDETVSTGGFSAGYSSGTLTLRTKAHIYSEDTEPVDASWVGINGGKVIIVEKDPADPAAPIYWERTLATPARSNLDLTITSALSSPAWDPTKKYRIIFDRYSVCTALQRDYCFQADDADEMVENIEVPYHFCATPAEEAWSYNTTAKSEGVPSISHGDGRGHDVGHETAICTAVNNLYDHKLAKHGMCMWTEQPSSNGATWSTRYFGKLYLGLEQYSNAVTRYITVAPWLWLDNAGGATTGTVKVTFSRDIPKDALGGAGNSYSQPVFDSHYVQATWTTTSTTPAIGIDQVFEIGVKDLFWGMVYVTIETFSAYTRSLAKCRVGPRVLIL